MSIDASPAPAYPTECWYVVLEGRELGRKPIKMRRFGLDLVVWRDEQGAPQCVLDRCRHRGASLSLGRVREGHIECPFHGFRWDGEGGCVKVPCNGPERQRPAHLATRAFAMCEANDYVWMWWGEPQAAYPDPPWFEILDTANYAWAPMPVDCDVGYARGIENQLDWTHLPFVHETSIGRGFPEQVTVRSEVEGDILRTWIEDDPNGLVLTLNFPNIWMNPFGKDRVIGFAAFTPVDDTNSRLYFRTYTRRKSFPGFARLAARLTNFANRFILAQDLRVIHSQPPECTAHNRDEKLVQADLPIAQFRKEIARRARPPAELVQLRPPSDPSATAS